MRNSQTGLNPRTNFKLNTSDSFKPYITGKDIYNNSINVTERTDLITQGAVDLINRRACLSVNDILFASTGTGTVGRMAIIEKYFGDWSISESIYAIKPNVAKVDPKFLMYSLYSSDVVAQYQPKITKASVPHLRVADLLSVKITVPTLSVQRRIVKVLDNFDEICSDLKIGLPAEMEKRQQQYEYYRDKLLTFDGKYATILTERNGTERNGTERNGTERNGTERAGLIRLLQYVYGFVNVSIQSYFTRLKGTPITAEKMKQIAVVGGEIKIFAGGKTVIDANEKDIPNANITRVPAVLVQSRGVIDFIYYDKPFTFKNEMWAYTCSNLVTLKYLFYYLKNNVKYFRENASGKAD